MTWLLRDLNEIAVWAAVGVLFGVFCWFFDVQLKITRRRHS